MNLVFLDACNWDYDVATPWERPIGGSQSALCYLSSTLASRGHRVTLLNHTRRPRTVRGVECWSLANLPANVVSSQTDALIVLNGPAELGVSLRQQLPGETPLVLWTQHNVDQPAVSALSRQEV